MARKKVILPLLSLLLCGSLSARSGVDSLYFDMRSSFLQQIRDEGYSSSFSGEYLNFHLWGHLSDNLDYRIRQRFDKNPVEGSDIFHATDMMYLRWRSTERFSVMAGKYAVLIGGYEYDAAPIDVYYYSKFCNSLPQGFTFGLTGEYAFTPNQSLVLQICNSPLSAGMSSSYAYNLAWKGRLASWCETLWSANYLDDSRGKHIAYLALGNHMTFGSLLLDVDLMSRRGIGQDGPPFSDGTIIGKLIWSIGEWNVCTKSGYEWNDADNVDSSGEAFDTVIAPGTEYFYTGCGLEWFPWGRDKVRLHAVFYRDSQTRCSTFSFGVTSRLGVYKRAAERNPLY